MCFPDHGDHGQGPFFISFVHEEWNNTTVIIVAEAHILINYMDTKSKYRHLKEYTCEGTLRQVFFCLRPFSL